MNDFGVFLKEIRYPLSLREASDRSGLSASYISYLEKGARPGSNTPIKVSPEALQKLANAYDYSYEHLMMKAGYLEPYLIDIDDIDINDIESIKIETEKDPYVVNEPKVNYDTNSVKANSIFRLRSELKYFLEQDEITYDGRILSEKEVQKIKNMLSIIFE